MMNNKYISMTNKKGFSLVELLVVISIIALLLTMLIPAITNAVGKSKDNAKCLAMMQKMSDAVDQYYNRIGVFPGQPWSPGQTGSELLARAAFSPIDDPASFPASAFADYRRNDLITYNSAPMISDAFKDPMPILYFPSDMSKKGQSDQYSYSHNSSITGAGSEGDFNAFITDPSMPSIPYNDGGYLLIAAGADRQYFTDDDLTNFKRN